MTPFKALMSPHVFVLLLCRYKPSEILLSYLFVYRCFYLLVLKNPIEQVLNIYALNVLIYVF